jgi:hypothetical protein
MGRAALAVVAVLVIVGAAAIAHAESVLVVIARPSSSGTLATEVLNRARGELLADGFTVLVVDAVARENRVASLSRTGRATGGAVAAGLFVEEGAGTVDLCLVDSLTGRVMMRSLDAPPNSADQTPQVVARRTVDLLRASLLEFLVQGLRSAVTETRAPVGHASRIEAKDQSVSGWTLEGGLAVLGSFDGLGPAFMPLVRVGRVVVEPLQLRLTGAWLGTQPRVETATGAATVEQGVAVFECVARFFGDRRLRPLASLGAGTYYVGVNGIGVSPYRGAHSSEFALALDAGVGVATVIASNLEAVVEVHALVTDPGLAVRFVDVDAAKIGRPSLLVTFTVAGAI